MMLSAWMEWSNFQSMESLLMEYAIRHKKRLSLSGIRGAEIHFRNLKIMELPRRNFT